jgi:hypothetical protein
MVCVIDWCQVYDQLVAMDDFLTFKKLMVRHNHTDRSLTARGMGSQGGHVIVQTCVSSSCTCAI